MRPQDLIRQIFFHDIDVDCIHFFEERNEISIVIQLFEDPNCGTAEPIKTELLFSGVKNVLIKSDVFEKFEITDVSFKGPGEDNKEKIELVLLALDDKNHVIGVEEVKFEALNVELKKYRDIIKTADI